MNVLNGFRGDTKKKRKQLRKKLTIKMTQEEN